MRAGPRPGAGPARAVAAFAAMAAVYFFSHFQRTAIPGTIFDELQVDVGLAAAGVAALGSMFTWIYGGMQVFAGLAVDGWGGKRTLVGGGLAMAAGSLLFPLAQSAPLLFAARALTGFGAAFIYLSILKEINLRFGSELFPATLGILLAVGYCGGMTATLPFERAVAAVGWRTALLAVAGITVAAVAAAWLLYPRSRGDAPARGRISLRPLVMVLTNRTCLPSFVSSFLSFPVYFVVLTTLGKKFLQDSAGVGSAAAAGSMLAMTAVGAVTAATGGFLPRLFGGRRKPCILIGSGTIALAVGILLAGTLLHAPAGLFLAGYIMLAAAIGVAAPSGAATVKDLNRPDSLGAGLSVTNALSYVGCGTLAQACGILLDRFRPAGTPRSLAFAYPQAAYVALFSFLLAVGIVNLASTLMIPETGRPARVGETGGGIAHA